MHDCLVEREDYKLVRFHFFFFFFHFSTYLSTLLIRLDLIIGQKRTLKKKETKKTNKQKNDSKKL